MHAPSQPQYTVVGAAYAASGVTFNDATAFSQALPGSSAPNVIESTTNGAGPTQAAPISATFSSNVSSVSLTGLGVGGNGFLLRGFNAVTGGGLIGSQQVFGATEGGTGEFFTLTIATPGIRRIEFSRVNTNIAEGLAFDNLIFDIAPAAVPEPATAALVALGLSAAGLIRRSRRQ